MLPRLISLLILGMTPIILDAAPKPGDVIDDLNIQGKLYVACRLLAVEPDGITIVHSIGVAKIPFSILPEPIQQRFAYDPAEAESYAKEVKAREQAAFEKAIALQSNAADPAPVAFMLPHTLLERQQREAQLAQNNRAKLEEILSRRRQEEEEAAQRREAANERMKERSKKPKKK